MGKAGCLLLSIAQELKMLATYFFFVGKKASRPLILYIVLHDRYSRGCSIGLQEKVKILKIIGSVMNRAPA